MNYNTKPTINSKSSAFPSTDSGKEQVNKTDGLTDAFFDATLGYEVNNLTEEIKETVSVVNENETEKSEKKSNESSSEELNSKPESENTDRLDTLREHEIGDQEIPLSEIILADKKKIRRRKSNK